jgi:hypothetical protein
MCKRHMIDYMKLTTYVACAVYHVQLPVPTSQCW